MTSELHIICQHQLEALEKSKASHQCHHTNLTQTDQSAYDSSPNLRRQLMHDVEQLRQCALAVNSSRPQAYIPAFDQDLSLDPSILALRHALVPIGKAISNLLLALTAAKKLAAERALELRKLEAVNARLVQQPTIVDRRSEPPHRRHWGQQEIESHLTPIRLPVEKA